MKIAFLVGEFPTLSETFVLNQITGLIDQGHEVDIYASPPKQLSKIHPDVKKYDLPKRTFYYEEISPNYLLRSIKGLYLFTIWGIRYPRQILRSTNLQKYGNYAKSLRLLHEIVPFLRHGLPKYDVIHCHFGMNGIKGMYLRQLGVIQGKLSTVFHGFDISGYLDQVGKDTYNQLFRVGDLFLPISEHWRKRLLELGAPDEKTVVHHMGIDCQEFKFKVRECSLGEKTQITTVCRLVEKKGVEYGIRAVAALKERFSNLEYMIIGDGPLQEELERLIAELQADDVIKILGWQPQDSVVKWLEKTHLFLAPSVTAHDGDQEGIPVALMEAMAMGIPVISTYHSGIPELVENGNSGILTVERNVGELIDRFKMLLGNPQVWKSIGLSARHKVEEEFDVSKLNQQLAQRFQLLTEALEV
ncbi:MAG: glycosyltransferase [Elainella sp. Prado103]|jgi:colanic acid/amylovoran biosynthesis glycosyltransferase|nr:glycosyltransferase [Elainella sp. Prado103]